MQLRKIGTKGIAVTALAGALVAGVPTAAQAAPPVGNSKQCTHSGSSESPNWYTEIRYDFVSEGKYHKRNTIYVRTHTVEVNTWRFGMHSKTTKKYDCLS
ncbi:hypothetical protein [Nocardiopsis halophila]|uniref:hypothetical protein n=1 Tax=Nocardiopsis halophila TaxID=141692 RepID=UPI001268809D|nr:hypothetical protein [Nocardiopsis halophila]